MSDTFQRVANWNMICGKMPPKYGTEEYLDALSNQAERIEEELKELQEAIGNCRRLNSSKIGTKVPVTYKGLATPTLVTLKERKKWAQEVLDAGCDLDVVVSGLNYLSGHDYSGAITAVLDNNDEKYTHDLTFAELSLKKYGEGHNIKQVDCRIDNLLSGDQATVEQMDKLGYDLFQDGDGVMFCRLYSVHRDSDDKICKLLNHPSVDLAPFVGGNVE